MLSFLTLGFAMNSILVGAGLGMDAFTVSVANGINNPKMAGRQQLRIAGTYAFFQFMMPMIGWAGMNLLRHFVPLSGRFMGVLSCVILSWIGIHMLFEARKMDGRCEEVDVGVSFGTLVLQAIATSIDALSVGVAFASYTLAESLGCYLIVAIVTLVMCTVGLRIGCRVGSMFSKHATMVGGVLLIAIGIEMLIKAW